MVNNMTDGEKINTKYTTTPVMKDKQQQTKNTNGKKLKPFSSWRATNGMAEHQSTIVLNFWKTDLLLLEIENNVHGPHLMLLTFSIHFGFLLFC